KGARCCASAGHFPGISTEMFRPQHAFCMAPLSAVRYIMTERRREQSSKGHRRSRGSLRVLPERPARNFGTTYRCRRATDRHPERVRANRELSALVTAGQLSSFALLLALEELTKARGQGG